MKLALDQFNANLARARALCGLANSLSGLTTAAVDVSDIYRAAIVLSVSALDQFVHEFVRLGMLEIHHGTRQITNAILSFKVSLAAARAGMSDPKLDDWLDAAVREAHSWQSFQFPDRIADALRLVTNIKLWEEVAKTIGSDLKTVKARLTAIVDRRNKIAHEADMDPTNPGVQWPIDNALTEDALNYIDTVVNAIYKCAV